MTETDSQGYPLRPMGQAQWDKLADRMGAAAERALDAAQHGTPEAKAEAIAAHEGAKARANQENPWEHPQLWDEAPMSPEDEEQAGWA